jgi:mRNA-degrading endonuclease YafQ of YafQ-DinJ toxin-antitoxin module
MNSKKSAATMYSVDTTKRFDKDLKRCLKRGLNLKLVYDAWKQQVSAASKDTDVTDVS